MVDIDKDFVFIGGLHRSGTSLLHRCIADHPKVSGFSETDSPRDEGQKLQNVYEPAESHGGPGVFGFDSDSYLDESSRLANRDAAEELLAEWSEYWDFDKPVLVEKSPPNLVRGRFLQALFPKTHFIMIVRHPIAVSYATRKWTDVPKHLHRRASSAIGRRVFGKLRAFGPSLRLPIWLLIRHWVICHEKLKRDKEKIENLLVVKYESLTERPTSTLEKVWDFLGLEPFTPKREIKRGLNQKYFDRWRKLKEQRRLLGSLYSKYILSRYENRVGNLGYSLDV